MCVQLHRWNKRRRFRFTSDSGGRFTETYEGVIKRPANCRSLLKQRNAGGRRSSLTGTRDATRFHEAGKDEREFDLRCNSCEGLSFSSAQFSLALLSAGAL